MTLLSTNYKHLTKVFINRLSSFFCSTKGTVVLCSGQENHAWLHFSSVHSRIHLVVEEGRLYDEPAFPLCPQYVCLLYVGRALAAMCFGVF
jgi:hypothetical protein